MNKNYFLGILLSTFISMCGMEPTQEPFPLMQLPDELLLKVIGCTPPPLDEAIPTIKALRLVNKRFRSLLTAQTDLSKVTQALARTCNVPYLKALQELSLSLPACQKLKTEWHKNTIKKLKIALEEKEQRKLQNGGIHLQRTCWQPDGNLLLGVLYKHIVIEKCFAGPLLRTLYWTVLMRLDCYENVDTNYLVRLTESPEAKNVLPSDGFKRFEFINCPSNPNVCAFFCKVILGIEQFQMVGKWENGQIAHRSLEIGSCDLRAHPEWNRESVQLNNSQE